MSCKWNYLLVLQSSNDNTWMYIELLRIMPNCISGKVSLSDDFVLL